MKTGMMDNYNEELSNYIRELRESERKEIDAIIAEIDQSLIDLRHPKNKEYKIFDFAEAIARIHQLVYWNKTTDYEEKLSKYFSVFNDLNGVFSEKTIKYYKLDPSGARVYEVYRKVNGISAPLKLRDMYSFKDRWLDNISLKLGDSISISEKKILCLLENIEYWCDEQDVKKFKDFRNWVDRLFDTMHESYERYNFDIVRIDLSITFEKYVNEIQSTETEKVTFNIPGPLTNKKVLHEVIALKCYYLSKTEPAQTFDEERIKEIAVNYGHLSKTSGSKIYRKFYQYSKDPSQITRTNHSDRTKENKKNNILSAIKELQGNPQAIFLAQQHLLKLQY